MANTRYPVVNNKDIPHQKVEKITCRNIPMESPLTPPRYTRFGTEACARDFSEREQSLGLPAHMRYFRTSPDIRDLPDTSADADTSAPDWGLFNDIREKSAGGARSLRYYKTHPDVPDPLYGSLYSACFDLHAWIPGGSSVSVYQGETERSVNVIYDADDASIPPFLLLFPGDRALVPMGLIFDIDVGYSLRLHSRSGLSLRRGLVLANSEGIVDADYVKPVYAIFTNTSGVNVKIHHNERCVQGEIVSCQHLRMEELSEPPAPKSERDGGFGSTGV